jgi:molecular chaperone Hsp33
MVTSDKVIRAIGLGGRARIFTALTTSLARELQKRHGLWPVASAALGRTATIAAMMGMNLKNKERLFVRIKGDGPLGQIVVDADSEAKIRGYVENPHVHLPANAKGKLDVGGGVGQGMLYITRDSGLKDYYTGGSEIQTGEIADDFTYYFAKSEQTPSATGAGVLVDVDNSVICAGGFLIQLMPGHTEDDVQFLERRLAEVPSVTDLLQTGLDAKGLLSYLIDDAEIMNETKVSFFCSCSRERLSGVLRSLGTDELQSMVDEQGKAEIICHFCGEVYQFTRQNLEEMISDLRKDGRR